MASGGREAERIRLKLEIKVQVEKFRLLTCFAPWWMWCFAILFLLCSNACSLNFFKLQLLDAYNVLFLGDLSFVQNNGELSWGSQTSGKPSISWFIVSFPSKLYTSNALLFLPSVVLFVIFMSVMEAA